MTPRPQEKTSRRGRPSPPPPSRHRRPPPLRNAPHGSGAAHRTPWTDHTPAAHAPPPPHLQAVYQPLSLKRVEAMVDTASPPPPPATPRGGDRAADAAGPAQAHAHSASVHPRATIRPHRGRPPPAPNPPCQHRRPRRAKGRRNARDAGDPRVRHARAPTHMPTARHPHLPTRRRTTAPPRGPAQPASQGTTRAAQKIHRFQSRFPNLFARMSFLPEPPTPHPRPTPARARPTQGNAMPRPTPPTRNPTTRTRRPSSIPSRKSSALGTTSRCFGPR